MNQTMIKNEFYQDKGMDILGYLFWYSIGEININREELGGLLKESKIDTSWLPKPIRKIDAFRRATNEIQTSRRMNKQKTYHNLLIRETHNDKEYLQRNVIIENVNKKNNDLRYNASAATFYFNKEDGDFTYYNESGLKEIEDICKEVKNTFKTYSTCYNGQHVRSIVMNILRTLTPIAMKREGYIYFISAHLQDWITRLAHFINALRGSEAYQIPFDFTEDNQCMVLNKLHERYDFLLERAKQHKDFRKDQINTLIADIRTLTEEFENLQEIIHIENSELENKNQRLKYEIFRIS